MGVSSINFETFDNEENYNRLLSIFDKKYYRTFQPDVPEGKEIEHYLEFGLKSGKHINPLFTPNFIKSLNPHITKSYDILLEFLKTSIDSKIPPHSLFMYRDICPQSVLLDLNDITDLLYFCMRNPPKNLRTIQIFSMLGGGRIFLNSLARSLYGNYLVDHVMDGIPNSDGYAFSGHLWAFKSRNEGIPPSKTRILLSKAEALEFDMIMCLRHPIDSLLSNFFGLFVIEALFHNSLKILVIWLISF